MLLVSRVLSEVRGKVLGMFHFKLIQFSPSRNSSERRDMNSMFMSRFIDN